MKQFNLSYLSGVYLAINAIKDAYLLMDAPNCSYKKMEYIDKNHDFYSDIFRNNGFHRIAHTDATTESVINNRNEKIKDFLIKISKYPDSGVIFLASMPMASLTGIQYDLIINQSQKETAKAIIGIPAKNLSSDWLGGYANTLQAIAEKIDLSKKEKKNNSVGIIGYFMDRNEGDHQGNLIQIEKYLNELGLDLTTIWLNGSSYEELNKIQESQLIISLPYAQEAAKIVSQKTGADLLELDLPFGLENTTSWILKIAEYFKKEEAAKKLIDQEMKEVVPILKWVSAEYFSNKKYSLIGDPYLLDSMITAINEIGGGIDKVIIYGQEKYLKQMKNINLAGEIFTEKDFNAAISFNSDMVIGNSEGIKISNLRKIPYLQLGFPSNGWHCFSVNPFLGYKGFIGFVNRVINSFNSFIIEK